MAPLPLLRRSYVSSRSNAFGSCFACGWFLSCFRVFLAVVCCLLFVSGAYLPSWGCGACSDIHGWSASWLA
ncbi:hypothetical protein EJB05_23999, partial [Eragrostis curvula]